MSGGCFRRSRLSLCRLPSFRSGVGRCFSLAMVFARSNVCPRTGLPISVEMVPSIVAEDGIAFGVYCWLAEGSGIFVLVDSCPVALVVFAGSPEGRKEL